MSLCLVQLLLSEIVIVSIVVCALPLPELFLCSVQTVMLQKLMPWRAAIHRCCRIGGKNGQTIPKHFIM